MIQITDKALCCGCSACAQRCPRQCISMQEDAEGFLYPTADASRCIQCGLCERVCPVLHPFAPLQPQATYAAACTDDVLRAKSSSGGIFSVLAASVINDRGGVFGARFNDAGEVVHDCAANLAELDLLRGSKYVQSRMSDVFRRVEAMLAEGRPVLFSGTPCQVAGLKHYLRTEPDGLLTVEVACHGAPSPAVWRSYLHLLSATRLQGARPGRIFFRDKSTGWRTYSFSIKDARGQRTLFSERGAKNKFMLAFLGDLILRPSCYACPAKGGRSHADITLADYWGIERICPALDDGRGTSLVVCRTGKGLRHFQAAAAQMRCAPTSYAASVPFNQALECPARMPSSRPQYWSLFEAQGGRALLTLKPRRPSLIRRIINRILR